MARRAGGGDVEAGTSRGVHVATVAAVEEDDTRARTYSHSGRTALEKRIRRLHPNWNTLRRGEERRGGEGIWAPVDDGMGGWVFSIQAQVPILLSPPLHPHHLRRNHDLPHLADVASSDHSPCSGRLLPHDVHAQGTLHSVDLLDDSPCVYSELSPSVL